MEVNLSDLVIKLLVKENWLVWTMTDDKSNWSQFNNTSESDIEAGRCYSLLQILKKIGLFNWYGSVDERNGECVENSHKCGRVQTENHFGWSSLGIESFWNRPFQVKSLYSLQKNFISIALQGLSCSGWWQHPHAWRYTLWEGYFICMHDVIVHTIRPSLFWVLIQRAMWSVKVGIRTHNQLARLQTPLPLSQADRVFA